MHSCAFPPTFPSREAMEMGIVPRCGITRSLGTCLLWGCTLSWDNGAAASGCLTAWSRSVTICHHAAKSACGHRGVGDIGRGQGTCRAEEPGSLRQVGGRSCRERATAASLSLWHGAGDSWKSLAPCCRLRTLWGSPGKN